MTIIIFLVDTSASMNQRTYMGTTLLDTAKSAVEMFLKIRSRDPNCKWDRYMLLTFENPPSNVKAGWKENHSTFMKELKNLEATDLSSVGFSIKYTFDMLNTNRMQTGIDTYGQGRCPFFLEPAIIICLTDGRKMTSINGASSELILPSNASTLLGSELTLEPFRWDQRLYAVVLRMPATPPVDPLSYIGTADDAAIDNMCTVTGGRSYAVTSQRVLMQCLDSLVLKCQNGVVVNFEKIDMPSEKEAEKRPSSPTPSNTLWHSCRRLLYVPRSAQRGGAAIGHWPIPESFWPQQNLDKLPARTAHPLINFSIIPSEAMMLENLPFDKYDLEPSPLTQYILERRQPNLAWQVFIAKSGKYSEYGHPFGYIKPSTNLMTVHLYVLPYNYTILIPLLDELFRVHRLKPNSKWRLQFDSYLKTVPPYYSNPLKRAFARLGIPPTLNLIPEQMDSCLNYSLVSYLKKIKNLAKQEYDRFVLSIGQTIPIFSSIRVAPQRTNFSPLLRPDFHVDGQYDYAAMQREMQQTREFETFSIHAESRLADMHVYTNPFDINRLNLLSTIHRMKLNFNNTINSSIRLGGAENLHSISIQEMGNYQDFLKKSTPPLRDVEIQPSRLHTFGNPFKVNKNLMIDEADEAMPGLSPGRKRTSSESSSASSQRPSKRKKGPIPRSISTRDILTQIRKSATSILQSTPFSIPLSSPLSTSLSTPPQSSNMTLHQPSYNPPSPGIFDEVSAAAYSPFNTHSYDVDRLNNLAKDESLEKIPDVRLFNSNLASNGNSSSPIIVDLTETNNFHNHKPMVNGFDYHSPSIPFRTNRFINGSGLKPISKNGILENGIEDLFGISRRVQNGKVGIEKEKVVGEENEKLEENDQLTKMALSQVRRPGRDYSELISIMRKLHGTIDEITRCYEIVAREARRFKRHILVTSLQDLQSTIDR